MKEVILATPRTGSSFLTRKISEETNQVCYDEIFNLAARSNTSEKICEHISRIKKERDGVVKIFPSDFTTTQTKFDFDLAQYIIRNKCKIHTLYRKDYNAQLRSFYLAIISQNYHDTWEGTYDIPYHEETFEKVNQWLQNEISLQASYFNLFADKIGCAQALALEDFATDENKYQRQIAWIDEPPQISFNTAKFFIR